MNRRSRMVRAALAFGVLAVLALLLVRLADHIYAWRVEQRYAEWEASVERDADGVRTGFEPFKAGEGAVGILFVHGFAGSPSLYRYFVPYFAEHGFACRAIRLPGFGETVDRAAEVRRADWVRAVRSAALEMRAEHETVWIVAHSLGGTVALRALQADAALADGLVLLAPLLEVSDARSPILEPEEWFAVGEFLVAESDVLESIFPIDAHDPRVREKEERDLFIPLDLYSELFALLDDLDAGPADVDIPVMMVLSKRDKIVDSDAAEAWFTALTNEANRLLVVEPAGHVLPLDTGWDSLLTEIKDYVVNHARNRDTQTGRRY